MENLTIKSDWIDSAPCVDVHLPLIKDIERASDGAFRTYALLRLLAKYSNEEGSIQVEDDQIAEFRKVSPRTIQAHIDELTKAKLLERLGFGHYRLVHVSDIYMANEFFFNSSDLRETADV